ncbi:MAG: tellurite resistance TerB family protein [Acetobacteraceae bacterium]
MRSRDALDSQEALVLTMVLVAAADGGITDREIGVMAGQVGTLPVFRDFRTEQFDQVTEAAVALLRQEDGLDRAARMIRSALDVRLRETAYALACEVVAADMGQKPSSLEMLAYVKAELHLDSLVATAIERAVRARHQRVDLTP